MAGFRGSGRWIPEVATCTLLIRYIRENFKITTFIRLSGRSTKTKKGMDRPRHHWFPHCSAVHCRYTLSKQKYSVYTLINYWLNLTNLVNSYIALSIANEKLKSHLAEVVSMYSVHYKLKIIYCCWLDIDKDLENPNRTSVTRETKWRSNSNVTHWLGTNYYVNFLGGIGSNGFHIKSLFSTHGSWKNQNPGDRFGATTANSAHFARFLGKWAKLAVLFSW